MTDKRLIYYFYHNTADTSVIFDGELTIVYPAAGFNERTPFNCTMTHYRGEGDRIQYHVSGVFTLSGKVEITKYSPPVKRGALKVQNILETVIHNLFDRWEEIVIGYAQISTAESFLTKATDELQALREKVTALEVETWGLQTGINEIRKELGSIS